MVLAGLSLELGQSWIIQDDFILILNYICKRGTLNKYSNLCRLQGFDTGILLGVGSVIFWSPTVPLKECLFIWTL